MSTSDAVKQSCSNAKGSNERPSNSDDRSTAKKPPNLKPQPSQSLPSLKPQTVPKHLTTDSDVEVRPAQPISVAPHHGLRQSFDADRNPERGTQRMHRDRHF